MCTLAIRFQCSPVLPVVVAANRDEFYARPTAPPRMIATDPWIVAGQDLNAGGTWLGVNEAGLIVGVLNRRNPNGPSAERRSRGLLCFEALQRWDPASALAHVSNEPADAYNWFNLLIANADHAFVVSNYEDEMEVQKLPPGTHVLTNSRVNDRSCPRIVRSRERFAAIPLDISDAELPLLVSRFQRILADHTPPPTPRSDPITSTLCVHAPGYGTRSSSVLAHIAASRQTRFWHASGPPCSTDFREVDLSGAASAGQKPPERIRSRRQQEG